LISVIVPVLNGLPWLRGQLEALSAQQCDEPWEVVVADNGSTDGSIELVVEWAKRWEAIRLIDASKRPGPAAARNVGVGDAKGDRLAFCDADDLVEAGWLAALSEGLSHADVVAGFFDFMDATDKSSEHPPQPAPMRHHVFLPAGLAANLAVNRRAFEAVGGFAEEMFVGEDIDLCWRLQLAGYAFDLAQHAIVRKRGRTGFREIFRTCFGYGASGPHLYRRHRAAGAGREFLRPAKTWAWLLVTIPRLRHPGFRRLWVSNLGVRVGRLLGSAHYRVFVP
jgi:glycosyltransferase involved in cell wall biosynthesis